MINFKIDKEKCTQCKACVIDCPVLIINGKTEYPEIKEGKEDNCIKCQHCLAVCPEAALSIWDKVPENSISTSSPMPAPEKLENLMQTRRSTRRFKKEELDKDLINRLVSMASYAPTAKNENAVQFTVVDNKEDMATLRTLTYDAIKKASDEGRIPEAKLYLANFQQVWESKGIDVIYRNAPHIIITSAPKSCTTPVIDCTLAMTYFDLLANSNGIGTLWDGFATNVFAGIAPELSASIGIPEDHVVTMALAFGLPKTSYPRSVQNDQPNINTVSFK